jgi:hypothetical protein
VTIDEQVEANPYRALHLLPSAPQALIVETYWHLVRDLQGEDHNGSSRDRVEVLNRAYAALMADGSRPSSGGAGEDGAATVVPTAHRGLLGRRRPSMGRTERSPWELLHVEPGAPQGVIDLAYRYWRLRLRGERGESALELIDKAYADARERGATPDQETCTDDAAEEASTGEPETPAAVEEASSAVVAPEDLPAQERRRPWTLLASVLGAAAVLVLWVLRQAVRSGRAGARRLIALPAAGWRRARSKGYRGAKSRPAAKQQPLIASEQKDDSLRDDETPALEQRLASLATPTPVRLAQAPPPEASAVRGYLLPQAAGAPSVAITALQPVTIGAHSRCDIVIPSRNGSSVAPLVARIWAQDDKVMLHTLSEEAHLRVNGGALAWAELEEGDLIEAAGAGFLFSRAGEQPA